MKKAAVAIALILLLSGCSVPSSPEKTKAPSATPTMEAPTPTTTPIEEEAWVTYTDGSVEFEHPADWSVSPELMVLDGGGTARLTYVPEIDGIGGACEDEFPVYELDTAETTLVDPNAGAIRFAYNALETPDGVLAGLGLTARAPTETGCLLYFIVTMNKAISFASGMQLNPGAGIPFDSIDAANAYIDTDEYQTMRRIILSLKVLP